MTGYFNRPHVLITAKQSDAPQSNRPKDYDNLVILLTASSCEYQCNQNGRAICDRFFTHCANYIIIKLNVFIIALCGTCFSLPAHPQISILRSSLDILQFLCSISEVYILYLKYDIQRHIQRTIPIDRLYFTLVGEYIN